MPYTFTLSNPADFTDEQIAQGVELGNTLGREVLPDDPPTPVDVAIASHRAVPARYRRYNVRAHTEAGELVGATAAAFDDEHDTNPDILRGGVRVHGAHRVDDGVDRLEPRHRLAHHVARRYRAAGHALGDFRRRQMPQRAVHPVPRHVRFQVLPSITSTRCEKRHLPSAHWTTRSS